MDGTLYGMASPTDPTPTARAIALAHVALLDRMMDDLALIDPRTVRGMEDIEAARTVQVVRMHALSIELATARAALDVLARP